MVSAAIGKERALARAAGTVCVLCKREAGSIRSLIGPICEGCRFKQGLVTDERAYHCQGCDDKRAMATENRNATHRCHWCGAGFCEEHGARCSRCKREVCLGCSDRTAYGNRRCHYCADSRN